MQNTQNEFDRIDSLTGVFTKEYFYREARKLIDENTSTRFAILELDINRLTMINELMGIAQGDRLLAYIGTILNEIFAQESNCVYGRIHADLFVVCCPYNSKRMNQYIRLIEQSIKEYHISFEILISFGIYICEERDLNLSIMCDRANLALKSIKGNYMTHYALYDRAMHDKMIREQEITQKMGKALENHEFLVYYQPKHSLDDDSLIGAEALVRWKDPQKGLISPGDFIPVFEENGFIMKLDAFVWEETCKFISEQVQAKKKIPPISVNISRVNLYNPELCDILQNLVKTYHIPYNLLELELTESAYTDNPQLMLQTMAHLQKMGFRIAMDDFGSGYSSLNMLKDVPVDILKIDLKFLSSCTNPEKGTSIMAAVVRMAKWLGIPAIVEGVESKEQVIFLRSIGCTMAQGYYYAKPMPKDDFITYMNRPTVKNENTKKHLDEISRQDIEKVWNEGEKNFDYLSYMYSACGLYEMSQNQLELLRATDSYYEMIQSSREQFYFDGLYLLGWIPSSDRAIVMNMFKDADEGKVGCGIYRRNCPDGKTIWLYTKVKYLSGDGNRKLYMAVMDDISDKVDADTYQFRGSEDTH